MNWCKLVSAFFSPSLLSANWGHDLLLGFPRDKEWKNSLFVLPGKHRTVSFCYCQGIIQHTAVTCVEGVTVHSVRLGGK